MAACDLSYDLTTCGLHTRIKVCLGRDIAAWPNQVKYDPKSVLVNPGSPESGSSPGPVANPVLNRGSVLLHPGGSTIHSQCC